MKLARNCWLLLAGGHLNRKLFGKMLNRFQSVGSEFDGQSGHFKFAPGEVCGFLSSASVGHHHSFGLLKPSARCCCGSGRCLCLEDNAHGVEQPAYAGCRGVAREWCCQKALCGRRSAMIRQPTKARAAAKGVPNVAVVRKPCCSPAKMSPCAPNRNVPSGPGSCAAPSP